MIRQALDEALDQAATDFGSAAFQEQVRIAADLDRARAQSEEVAAEAEEASNVGSGPPATEGPFP